MKFAPFYKFVKFNKAQIWLVNLRNPNESNLLQLAFIFLNLTAFAAFQLNLPQISRIS